MTARSFRAQGFEQLRLRERLEVEAAERFEHALLKRRVADAAEGDQLRGTGSAPKRFGPMVPRMQPNSMKNQMATPATMTQSTAAPIPKPQAASLLPAATAITAATVTMMAGIIGP